MERWISPPHAALSVVAGGGSSCLMRVSIRARRSRHFGSISDRLAACLACRSARAALSFTSRFLATCTWRGHNKKSVVFPHLSSRDSTQATHAPSGAYWTPGRVTYVDKRRSLFMGQPTVTGSATTGTAPPVGTTVLVVSAVTTGTPAGAGTSGVSGISGTTGSSGVTGTTGVAGSSGVAGITGEIGRAHV